MDKMYRGIVLAGLLVGLIANAVATYQLKSELGSMQDAMVQVQADIQDGDTNTMLYVKSYEEKTVTQIAEHDRMIEQLEKMLNYQLDN